tara:strand:+ start:1281 stop:1694 length:414 start_codon:yes stop_codon:yes gene_type:complete
MNLKSFKAVFFALIFLTSKIGLALNVHYCGGHIEEITFAWNAEGCEMSVKKAQEYHQDLKLTKNHCCKDQTVFIQNNEPQKTADYELQFTFFGILPNKPFQFDASKIIFFKSVFTPPKFFVSRNKIFLLHQSLVFYG